MAILHSLQHAVLSTNHLELCLDILSEGDALILLEDAVTAVNHQPSLDKLSQNGVNFQCFVIDLDLSARGITPQEQKLVACNIQVITYQEFVELSLSFDKVVNWA